MTAAVPRALVEAFYRAYGARDIDRVGEFLADDVTWTITGPVGLLRFCGTRNGKAATLDMIGRQISEVYHVLSFVPDAILTDGAWAATINRLSARLSECERVISYRVAHFLRFRDGKIVEMRALMDSYDAVEQVLGHHLAASGIGRAAEDLLATV
jgi:ketosteroid isomerase-like protein